MSSAVSSSDVVMAVSRLEVFAKVDLNDVEGKVLVEVLQNKNLVSTDWLHLPKDTPVVEWFESYMLFRFSRRSVCPQIFYEEDIDCVDGNRDEMTKATLYYDSFYDTDFGSSIQSQVEQHGTISSLETKCAELELQKNNAESQLHELVGQTKKMIENIQSDWKAQFRLEINDLLKQNEEKIAQAVQKEVANATFHWEEEKSQLLDELAVTKKELENAKLKQQQQEDSTNSNSSSILNSPVYHKSLRQHESPQVFRHARSMSCDGSYQVIAISSSSPQFKSPCCLQKGKSPSRNYYPRSRRRSSPLPPMTIGATTNDKQTMRVIARMRGVLPASPHDERVLANWRTSVGRRNPILHNCNHDNITVPRTE